MGQKITLKYIDATGSAPSPEFLSPGELALNRNDGILYYLHTSGTVRAIRAEDVNLGAIGIISTSVPFTGLSYDSQGAIFVSEEVIRRQPSDAVVGQEIRGPLKFTNELPRGPVNTVANEDDQLVNFATLQSADIDQGYF